MSLEFQRLAAVTPEFKALHAVQKYRQADEEPGPGNICYLALDAGKPVARLSICKAHAMRGLDPAAGLIGHYENTEAEAGQALLAHACGELHSQGCILALGPMNGNAWRRYRLALPPEAGQGDFFAGEPENQARYAAEFEAAGFKVRESYESRAMDLTKVLPWETYLPPRVRKRYEPLTRAIKMDRFEEELALVFPEVDASFAEAVLYSPITLQGFVAQFRPLKAILDPDFVRICCDEQGNVIGHVTAYPDGKRLILKTLAVRKEHRGYGLAAYLSYEIHALAKAKGYDSVIHALMHVDNRSKGMSKPFGELARRYALYEKAL